MGFDVGVQAPYMGFMASNMDYLVGWYYFSILFVTRQEIGMGRKLRRTSDEIVSGLMTRNGFRARVDAKCVDCIYDECAPGNWRQQVEACASPDCPLWDIRPKSSAQKEPDQEPTPVWWQQKK